MKDRWGVPAAMFGDAPEDFYSLVGRVALISALLEDRLHVLYCALARAPQDCLAGEPGRLLIRKCRQHTDAVPDERRDDAEAFLDAADAALLLRNEVVHSLWPFTGRDKTHGWRDIPRNRRDSAEIVQWTSLDAGQLPELVVDLVGLVERCRHVEQSVTRHAA